MQLKFLLAFILLALSTSGCLNKNKPDETPNPVATASKWPKIKSRVPLDPKIEKQVKEILAKMTVEEKVGQILQANISNITPEEITKYHIGSVLNGGGHFPEGKKHATAAEWVKLADKFYNASTDKTNGRVGIPLIWGSDAVHGHNNVVGATIFPHNIGLGAANDPDLIRRIGNVTAMEVVATGLDWTFAPTLAVVRDDRWGRTYESYSETPGIVASYAEQVVEGIQGKFGKDFLGDNHVLANAKHFIGDGGTKDGKDQGDNIDSEEELIRVHAPGYLKALEAGVQIVMASFSSWQGQKLHGNKSLITNVLKEQMGFDGFVISDWNAHASVKGCSVESCPEVINAGIDMIMAPDSWKPFYENTLKQVKSGTIPMSRLDDAVTRILRVKARAGLFSKQKPSLRKYAGNQDLLGAAEHRAVAREAVRKSLVLIKNENKVLPIRPTQKILLLGDGADNIGKQTGGWTLSWQGTGNTTKDFPNGTSIYEGFKSAIEKAGGQIELLTSASTKFKNKPDVAIIVYGEDPYAEFQGDRKNLLYLDMAQANLKAIKNLKEQGIPVVSIFLSGRPLWTNPYINASDAFVAAWLPGSEGAGVSDVILTKKDGSVHYDFQGRLSFSWPKTALQFGLNADRKDYDPLFEQGYGLTYAANKKLPLLSEDSGVDPALQSGDGVFFADGRPVGEWNLMISAGTDKSIKIEGGDIETPNKALSALLVDRNKQGDSRQFIWAGSEDAQVTISHDKEEDLSRQANGDLGLAVSFRVDEMPSAAIMMGMLCGPNCAGEFELTPYLKDVTLGEWTTLRWPLKCFEADGANMTQVTSVLSLRTKGKAKITVNDVRLATHEVEYQKCPK